MLHKFYLWLYRWAGKKAWKGQPPLDHRMDAIPRIASEVLDCAELHVAQYNENVYEARSGEYKRDRVYKALGRAFPQASRTTLAVAIEVAYLNAH